MKIKSGFWLFLIVGASGALVFLLLQGHHRAGLGRASLAAAKVPAVAVAREDGCPRGCSYQKQGCGIKGNVAFETGERIYHVPGQTYYDEADVRPERGERWFCTEEEAEENGWRRARL